MGRPAALFYADDRYEGLTLRRDHNASDEGPVLHSADQVPAVDQEHGTLTVVDDFERIDDGSPGGFGDGHRARGKPLFKQVVRQ
ncbi:MAG: hypothetical protein J5J06_06275 [Phycisphaerae bacterium]|nr:hypothetical protein [Phycisphaerae bacterium]